MGVRGWGKRGVGNWELGVGEEGSWELGVRGWGKRGVGSWELGVGERGELGVGEEGSWELGVREEGSWELGVGEEGSFLITPHSFPTRNTGARKQATELGTLHFFPPSPHPPIPPSSSPLSTQHFTLSTNSGGEISLNTDKRVESKSQTSIQTAFHVCGEGS
uniref:Uncharacterized protein n=1 Tax=Desertifilum tharense IPPAS B-1220 TaxID=1781255 RepID=A0ACD5GN83_9CYAN